MPTDGLSQSQPASPNPDMMPSSQPSSAEWAKLAEVLGIQAAYSIQAHSPPCTGRCCKDDWLDLSWHGLATYSLANIISHPPIHQWPPTQISHTIGIQLSWVISIPYQRYHSNIETTTPFHNIIIQSKALPSLPRIPTHDATAAEHPKAAMARWQQASWGATMGYNKGQLWDSTSPGSCLKQSKYIIQHFWVNLYPWN
jgi:hypothetical protein